MIPSDLYFLLRPLHIAGFILTAYLAVLSAVVLARKKRAWASLPKGLIFWPCILAGIAACIPLLLHVEELMAIVGGNKYERAAFMNRTSGAYAFYWALSIVGPALPCLLLVPPIQKNLTVVAALSWTSTLAAIALAIPS